MQKRLLCLAVDLGGNMLISPCHWPGRRRGDYHRKPLVALLWHCRSRHGLIACESSPLRACLLSSGRHLKSFD